MIALAIILTTALILSATRGPKQKSYRYVYQRHPFDGPQYFEVTANDPTDADVKALDYFERELFGKNVTIMTTFHRTFLP